MNDEIREQYRDKHPAAERRTWRVAVVLDVSARNEAEAVRTARDVAELVWGEPWARVTYVKTCTRGEVGNPQDGGIRLGEVT